MTKKKSRETKPKNEDKGADQRGLGERAGSKASAPPLHPVAKETGTKGESNVGVDESSGSE